MERSEPHATKLMQYGLISQVYTLPNYGADGDWGDETQKAYDAYVEDVTSEDIVSGQPARWPMDDINDLIQFYGRPDMERGAAPQSVPLTLPYTMQLAWGGRGWITRVFLFKPPPITSVTSSENAYVHIYFSIQNLVLWVRSEIMGSALK